MTDTGLLPNQDYVGDKDVDPDPGTYEDQTPSATIPPQRYYELGHNDVRAGGVSAASRHVTWTLRERGKPDKIVSAFGFHLNPQAITRGFSGRSQLQATRARFYVDNFGPGPTSIQVRQLVASGKHVRTPDKKDYVRLYEARQDVLRFLADIYYRVQRAPDTYDIYFHDNHWSRGSDELVYFPSNGVEVARAVEQHGVWAVNINMVSLERTPFKDWLGPQEDGTAAEFAYVSRTLIVGRGQTKLSTLVRALMRTKYRTTRNEKLVTQRILDLNPDIRRTRSEKIYLPDGTYLKTVTTKPFRLSAGQKVLIPVRI